MNFVIRGEINRFFGAAGIGAALLFTAGTIGMGSAPVLASGGGNGGGGGSTTSPSPDASATGAVIRLNNMVPSYNGSVPKGTVTLGYATDGSAQSIDFNLKQINVPNGTVLPVEVVTGVYHTIYSYYVYQILEYQTTPGTLVVNNGLVTLSLSTLKGDIVPPFALTTVGTTDVRIYSADGSTMILSGNVGKLRL